jgi:beta-glucosidase-like glycosyl hydrolase/CubicO group peptidase (beta-lactamase class C family)
MLTERQLHTIKQEYWVDSVFKALTPDERLGQLFMVAAYSNRDESHYKSIEKLIENQHIGGIIFFQGGAVRQANLYNRYQKLSKVPLWVGMDLEWGLGMRLDSTISYPRQMGLGAIQDDKWIYKMGLEVARQCKRIGVHVNFAPVIDVNNNPANPVIGSRSFGENRENVARKGSTYMKGMQDGGIYTTAKHFPGHGDTDVDSHYGLPVISKTKEQLIENELYPFRKLIADSVSGIMVSHLQVPAFEKKQNHPATISKSILTDLLRKEMKFDGLVFTDALNMKGIAQFYKPGEIDELALAAGNDVLLFSVNVPDGLLQIKQAIKSKKIKQSEVDLKVKKILRAKYNLGLSHFVPVETSHLIEDLNSPEAKLLKYQLSEQMITVAKNKNNLIPFQHLDTTSFASISIGLPKGNEFQEMLSNYAPFEHFSIGKTEADAATFESVYQKASKYETVVVCLHGVSQYPAKGFGISQQVKDFVAKLDKKTKVVLIIPGNAYSLKYFESLDYLICSYEDTPDTRKIVPQVLFGGITATGKLPVSAGNIKSGIGLNTEYLNRFRFSYPESVGMNSEFLNEIEYLVSKSIKDSVFPGCQIVVAKNGAVVYRKSFGFHSYDSTQKVTNHTIYDLASVTKVAATLQATMFLYERQVLDVNERLAKYLVEVKGTNKENILVRDVLMHQGGMIPYMEHWRKTVNLRESNGHYLKNEYYSPVRTSEFSLQVAQNIYARPSLRDSLWKWTVASEMDNKHKNKDGTYDYVYSDLDFYTMKSICERLTNQEIDKFMTQNFYQPLGLKTMMFNPLDKFPADSIAPTEREKVFRRQLIRGTVHDPGAAMMGGVSGHAGLFSNAMDLAILMQMNLQNGAYGGRHYFQEPTVPVFVKNYNKGNRRGLGWDKPEPAGSANRNGNASYVSDFASRNSFGHSGFTGTVVWADPDEKVVFVLLSNRVNPMGGENVKITKQAVRRQIQDLVYKSIINYKEARHQ